MKRGMEVIVMILIVLVSFTFYHVSRAEPDGASVEYLSNSTKNVTAPQSRTDEKGTITVLQLTTVQQNIKWKAYVGNVSGTLVLRDGDDYSIYEWPSGGAPSGEVYITRNDTVNWAQIECANYTSISAEESSLGHLTAAEDNINNTFSSKVHDNFDVGTVPILQSSCQALATYVNNSAQAESVNSLFQEVLLMDDSFRLVYSTIIDQDTVGYHNGTYYDFQAIVPDYVSASVATYYFYVEID